jgi:hypothetical protein
MKPKGFLLVALILAVTAGADPVGARSSFQARIPYGTTVGCAACHTQIPDRNAFGDAFHDTSPADSWTLALSLADSDGDGFANGVELQDPNFQWEIGEPDPGNPALVSNPGDPLSTAVDAATWGQVKELFRTLLRIPKG